jgi:hypothetical protein
MAASAFGLKSLERIAPGAVAVYTTLSFWRRNAPTFVFQRQDGVEVKARTEQGWWIARHVLLSAGTAAKCSHQSGQDSRPWSVTDFPRKALPESANGCATRVGTRISTVPAIPQMAYPNFGNLGTRFEELPVFWAAWVLEYSYLMIFE